MERNNLTSWTKKNWSKSQWLAIMILTSPIFFILAHFVSIKLSLSSAWTQNNKNAKVKNINHSSSINTILKFEHHAMIIYIFISSGIYGYTNVQVFFLSSFLAAAIILCQGKSISLFRLDHRQLELWEHTAVGKVGGRAYGRGRRDLQEYHRYLWQSTFWHADLIWGKIKKSLSATIYCKYKYQIL